MVEFAERNGYEWVASAAGAEADEDETVAIIEGVAAGKIEVKELVDWVKDRIRERRFA